MKARRAAIAARFTVFIETTALCALVLPRAFRRDDGIVRASARAMLTLLNRRFFAGVRDDVQARQPKAVRPTLALADFGPKPGPIVINACLRTEALERSTIPHQTELAMAVSAMVFHSYPRMASVEPTG